MNYISIICSSTTLREWMQNADGFVGIRNWEFYLDVDNELWVEHYLRGLQVEVKGNTRRIVVKRESVWLLRKMLDWITEQPLVIQITDEWDGTIRIKDAIL